jgi:hypothetical protein
MKSRHEELAAEEQKRERNWDPQLRWKTLQDMIAWVDAQQPIPRNSRAMCLRLQAEKLAQWQRLRGTD